MFIEGFPATISRLTEQWTGLSWIKLRQDGWYPSDLLRIFSYFNTAGIYFLYNLPRLNPEEAHHWNSPESTTYTEETIPSMQLCTAFRCIHRKLREDDCRTGHTNGCNGCQDVVANPDILSAILESGKIPLIICIDDDNENPEISFVVTDSDTSYVAIARVWPDDLGNLQRNSCSA